MAEDFYNTIQNRFFSFQKQNLFSAITLLYKPKEMNNSVFCRSF